MKVFLSHSSNDKNYVEKVANSLGKLDIHYNKFTFENGEKSKDEILRALNKTDLFVIFVSHSSMKSDWVKFELEQAQKLFNENKIKKFYL